MKRFMSAALVATLFASTALAQPPDRGGDRGDRGNRGGERAQRPDAGDRGNRGDRGDGGQRQGPANVDRGNRGERQQGPQQAQPAPQARPAPQAQQAPQAGPQPGRGSYLRSPGPQGDAARRGDDPRFVAPNRQDNVQRAPDIRRDDNRGDNRQSFDNRSQYNRPGFDNRSQGYRRPNQRQLRDRDRGRQWFDQRSFRPSYRSPQRFRVAPYRAPSGFFMRSWSFGDRLPYGWYGSGYYLNWGAYGLPFPPIGCEWVRVGSDALLVDVWTGEVLSVYYDLFW